MTLVDGKDLPVWGFPWQSNPYCRLTLSSQAVDSKRERETGGRGSFKNPTWNQDFQFLVEDGPTQSLEITIYDSPHTGRKEVGTAKLHLDKIPCDGTLMASLPVFAPDSLATPQGVIRVRASYRAFDDDDGMDSGVRVAEEEGSGRRFHAITDVKSVAAASAAATLEASQGLEALAVAKAAAARAAAARLRGQEGEVAEGSRGPAWQRWGLARDVEGDGVRSMEPSMLEDSEFAARIVRAVKEKVPEEDGDREAALAGRLSQRAVTKITDKDTPPQETAQIAGIVAGSNGVRPKPRWEQDAAIANFVSQVRGMRCYACCKLTCRWLLGECQVRFSPRESQWAELQLSILQRKHLFWALKLVQFQHFRLSASDAFGSSTLEGVSSSGHDA